MTQTLLSQSNSASSPSEQSDNHGMPAIGKVVCVGRNYAAHAAELGNAVPKRPILFIKPASSVIHTSSPIKSCIYDVPRAVTYDVHYEAELCIQLGTDLSAASVEEVKSRSGLIGGVTLGLDLTLRELQSALKQKGHPWERAKCFDGSCVLGDWVSADRCDDFSAVKYQLFINDTLTQDGDTGLMLFPIYQLLSEISYAFSLQAGDVIMTGTPSGVGILQAGDTLRLRLGEHEWQSKVV